MGDSKKKWDGNASKSQNMKSTVIWNRTRTTTSRRRRPIYLGRDMKGKQKQEIKTISRNETESITSTTSLSNKYQPRLFHEIVGQDIVVQTLSNAVQKKKIAPLYIFHGPNGTGKTSAARVFAMALNCESTNYKPCCSCKGCSRSLYTLELCSGNRINGFEKIKTLLRNTSFAQAIPGLKVFIIEECHLLTLEAWDEVLTLLEASNYVFLLITHVDVNSITRNITSRCQKFYFPKLNDDDVTKKLMRIVANERMVIEEEALKLIVAKSQGSLRDAENILDQLALLGPTINTSVVQQLVGLIPENKLLDLLAVAVSGDTINTIRNAMKLSECVEPASFVSQLVNLVTNLLSESRSRLSEMHSATLCNILKLLLETEKQLCFSTDKASNIIAAFLDITHAKASSNKKVLPTTQHSSSLSEITLQSSDERQEVDAKRGIISDMERLWKDVLKGIENAHTQKFLLDHAKLELLSISTTNAIVQLTFTRSSDKMAAEISQESITKTLEVAIGCPVTLHMNLQPLTSSGKFKQQNPDRNDVKSLEKFRLTKSKSCSTSQRPHRYLSKGRDVNMTHVFENPSSDTKDSQTTNVIQAGEDYKHAATQSMRIDKPRHRWLSLSSIPQSDASVEPYSQDVIYANFKKHGDETVRKTPKFQKGLSKSTKDRRFLEPADDLQSNPAWCC